MNLKIIWKKFFILVSMILIIGFLYNYRHDRPLGLIFGFYDYHHFCLEKSGKCVTVITYTPLNVGDNPFKRYVVFGKKKYDVMPPKVNYIEFPNDTGLAITWLSENECRIISNSPPQKEMKLGTDVKIEIIYSNVLYEKALSENPGHDVFRRPGKVLMKKGETFIF